MFMLFQICLMSGIYSQYQPAGLKKGEAAEPLVEHLRHGGSTGNCREIVLDLVLDSTF